MRIPAALTRCQSYARPIVEAAVREALTAAGVLDALSRMGRGARVLVKPNLLRPNPLTCTHPEVVRAACLCLLEHGLCPTVADSPGFGTARGVARAIGLADALRPLGLAVSPLRRAQSVPLHNGGRWRVSRLALESDAVLSIPRVKAHCQMRVTLAVKNLFGCVLGLHKALAHCTEGGSAAIFAGALHDMHAALPPVLALADGVTAMHVTGPSGGQPFALGCIAASTHAQALDTALCTLLGLTPDVVPLWAAAQNRALPGSRVEDLAWPLLAPQDFDASGFIVPELIDVTFKPQRLLHSLCRRIFARMRVFSSPRRLQ